MIRQHIVYTASEDAAGYGFLACSKQLAGYAATLLVLPSITEDGLDAALRQLGEFIGAENFSSRSRGVSGDANGAMGSIAISWNPGSTEGLSRPGDAGDASFNRVKRTIADTKRLGPLFWPHGKVALVVDEGLDLAQTLEALDDLRYYAHGNRETSDFLDPLPVERVHHEMRPVTGTTHDGMPVRA